MFPALAWRGFESLAWVIIRLAWRDLGSISSLFLAGLYYPDYITSLEQHSMPVARYDNLGFTNANERLHCRAVELDHQVWDSIAVVVAYLGRVGFSLDRTLKHHCGNAHVR